MSKSYQTAIKFAHRYLYGYLHHEIMSSFFDLLSMEKTADNQRKNSIEDAKKRQKIDEYIVHTFEKMPEYTASNMEVVAKEISTATNESIKANKPEWLKRGLEALVRYEKDTIALFEMLCKEAEEAKDNKLVEWIKDSIEDVKEELKVIEHFQNELQTYNYDYEKFKQEKGDKKMPRYYENPRHDYDRKRREMERERHYEPMGDDRFMPYMDDMDDDDMDDRFRFMPYYPMPYYYMDDDRYDPMEDRRGVPGTGRGRRRRRYR